MELAFASILYRMLAQLTKPPPTQARSIWRDAVVVVHSSPAWKCAPALDRDQTSEKWLKRMPRLLVRGSTAPPVTPGDGDSAY